MRIQSWRTALAAAALAVVAAAPAHADTYPSKPIRMVVTFPGGGAPDILARLFAEKSALGQPVVVDNKPGAGGNIGAEAAARSPADGYTLVLGTVGTHSINGSLYSKMPYDMVKDFTPIILVASTPNVLVVNPSVPAKDVAELIALAKTRPGALTFGTPGVGTSPHVAGEMFNTLAGVKLTHVPYKGRAMALPDLLGGHISMMFDNLPSALPVVREGKLRALGVTSLKRSPSAPDIPTLAEQGLPGFDADSWFAIFAPAHLPKELQDKLNAEANRVYSLPDVQAKMKTLGLEPMLGSPERLATFQRSEIAKWAKVIKASGAKAD
ncbi:ABC transporter substrate-binding protein [Cupriavidus sp. USMAA2-4]|uniref:ABC transporter substrate-binding protein n=1 Tax=Cupriavidus malaysiensis TaxID=367825 RepID=A0ABM6FEE4_9BURK|nr:MULTISPECIES: tripartite tricarboxylate transporter substrate binding protein [Cupriavidus]AOY94751.1 ABC transporter substrate-binding protein [Cupriavidus sp. USMAA2-4]AOZ02389.1 ABC transporter substrate-binding protein [Cupriavidus sp. USMAHM13]AOZ10239.1 ABC transporter substrate-binding protein [Cupriavidus malaysiensis]